MRTKFNPVFSFAAASALALAMGMPVETANATIMLTPAVATDTTNDNSNLTTLALINAAYIQDHRPPGGEAPTRPRRATGSRASLPR